MMGDREARKKFMERRRRNQRLRLLLIVLVLAAVAVLAVHWLNGRTPAPAPENGGSSAVQPPSPQTDPPGTAAPIRTEAPQTEPHTSAPETTEAPPDESWKLLLVNATHPLPEGYTVALKTLRNGHYVDERIYPELQQMFDDAREAGIYPFINESYRTAERQQEILDDYIASYEAQGMSHEEAVQKAHTIVAKPGTSEHQLGLAVDIVAEYDVDSTATWQWLKENAWRYGFILRYPADKVEITGIDYEPWHYRYVGCPTAQEITERGLCLEEYLESAG